MRQPSAQRTYLGRTATCYKEGEKPRGSVGGSGKEGRSRSKREQGWMDASVCSHPTSLQPSVVTTTLVLGSVCESLLRGQKFVWVTVKWRQKGHEEKQESLMPPSHRKRHKRQGEARATTPKVRNWWEGGAQPFHSTSLLFLCRTGGPW